MTSPLTGQSDIEAIPLESTKWKILEKAKGEPHVFSQDNFDSLLPFLVFRNLFFTADTVMISAERINDYTTQRKKQHKFRGKSILLSARVSRIAMCPDADIERSRSHLGKVLARGGFYEICEMPDVPNRWAKRGVGYRTKRYPWGVTVTYPMRWYTLVKYGVADLIRYEYQLYQKMPEELHPYLLQNVALGRLVTGKSVLYADKLLDLDGSPSKSLNETGPVPSPFFWDSVQTICNILERQRMYLLGVFHGGNHLYVQKLSEADWKPVIIDITKLGRRMYPFQVNLWSRSSMQRKFDRQFKRFRDRFMAGTGG